MADSRWYGQKAAASAHIKQALADGQEKSVESLVAGLQTIGVGSKNALKALYSEVVSGTAILTSQKWNGGTIRKGGA